MRGRGPLVVAVVVVVGLVVAVAVTAGDRRERRDAQSTPELQGDFADGMLELISEQRLDLRLAGGDRVVSFVVPPDRVAALDLPHLATHKAQGLPTRIVFRRQGDQYVVTAALDAPFGR